MTRIILASASPRRHELLGAIVPAFEVEVSHVPEETAGDPVEDATRLAAAKARAVAERHPAALVLGADTIVHNGARAFGKPQSTEDAREMLMTLQGAPHRVVTAIAAVHGGREVRAWSEARVVLTSLDRAAIERYVASGRPLDKAGAYAIQDEDVPTVATLAGCYCCVMGLPLWRLRSLLLGLDVPCGSPAEHYPRCNACPEASL